MSCRLLYFTALGLLSGVAMVSAQPGPITTSKNSNLVFPASTLLTNGLPGLSGPPVSLTVATVYQGGDLVMRFTHNGSDFASTAFLDAASSSSPGYGTSFRALSANAFAATSGTAASVTIVEIVFAPTITQAITRAGDQIIINGAGGFAGAPYRILTTTNVELPVVQWTPIVTNQFGANGGFSYTNVIQPNMPAQYFRVSLP